MGSGLHRAAGAGDGLDLNGALQPLDVLPDDVDPHAAPGNLGDDERVEKPAAKMSAWICETDIASSCSARRKPRESAASLIRSGSRPRPLSWSSITMVLAPWEGAEAEGAGGRLAGGGALLRGLDPVVHRVGGQGQVPYRRSEAAGLAEPGPSSSCARRNQSLRRPHQTAASGGRVGEGTLERLLQLVDDARTHLLGGGPGSRGGAVGRQVLQAPGSPPPPPRPRLRGPSTHRVSRPVEPPGGLTAARQDGIELLRAHPGAPLRRSRTTGPEAVAGVKRAPRERREQQPVRKPSGAR